MWDPRATGTSLTDDSISSGRGHAPGAWVHRLIVIVTGVALSAKYGAGQSTIVLSAGADRKIVEWDLRPRKGDGVLTLQPRRALML